MDDSEILSFQTFDKESAMTFIKDMLLIIKAELKRDWIFMMRYPLEPISFLFFMYMILLAIFFGFSQLAGSGNILNKEKMILGYCLMQFVMSTQMGWSGQIQNESQTGTLEQLSISGHSLGEVLFARGISQMPRQMVSFYLLLFAYKLSMPEINIHFVNAFQACIVMCVMAIGIYGISYLFAGLTLLFKRVGFFFQIINFAFLGLFWQDRTKLTEGGVLATLYDNFPLTMGMTNIQKSFISLPTMDSPVEWGAFLLNSSVFAAIGYLLFLSMEKKAREHGLLSQY
jgi:ABC-2 type transport system permease protein